MKFRIKEVITNGKSWFYPQEKYFYLFWSGWTTTYSGYDYSNVGFSTLTEAQEFITKEVGVRKKPAKKIVIHEVEE